MDKIMLGNHLRELRRKFGMTQKQLARTLHIDRSTYSYYELGKTWPDPPTLVNLTKIFGVDMLDLVSAEEERLPIHLSDVETADTRSNRNRKNDSMVTNTSKIYDLSEEEKQLILFYRIMEPEQKERMLNEAEAAAAKNVEKKPASEE